MLALAATPWALGHVPGYGCKDGCCSLKHPPQVSQANYHRLLPGETVGSEFHVRSDTSPVDVKSREIIYWDAVFKEEYDPTTFEIRRGCGGCMHGDDEPSDTIPVSYKKGVIEPFTQVQRARSLATAARLPASVAATDCLPQLCRGRAQGSGAAV